MLDYAPVVGRGNLENVCKCLQLTGVDKTSRKWNIVGQCAVCVTSVTLTQGRVLFYLCMKFRLQLADFCACGQAIGSQCCMLLPRNSHLAVCHRSSLTAYSITCIPLHHTHTITHLYICPTSIASEQHKCTGLTNATKQWGHS